MYSVAGMVLVKIIFSMRLLINLRNKRDTFLFSHPVCIFKNKNYFILLIRQNTGTRSFFSCCHADDCMWPISSCSQSGSRLKISKLILWYSSCSFSRIKGSSSALSFLGWNRRRNSATNPCFKPFIFQMWNKVLGKSCISEGTEKIHLVDFYYIHRIALGFFCCDRKSKTTNPYLFQCYVAFSLSHTFFYLNCKAIMPLAQSLRKNAEACEHSNIDWFRQNKS